MKTSIASLQERLADWTCWDGAIYNLGACLGFWPEFGAPYDNDSWRGYKDVMHTTKYGLGVLETWLDDLVEANCLEKIDIDTEQTIRGEKKMIPLSHYRWNKNFTELDINDEQTSTIGQ